MRSSRRYVSTESVSGQAAPIICGRVIDGHLSTSTLERMIQLVEPAEASTQMPVFGCKEDLPMAWTHTIHYPWLRACIEMQVPVKNVLAKMPSTSSLLFIDDWLCEGDICTLTVSVNHLQL